MSRNYYASLEETEDDVPTLPNELLMKFNHWVDSLEAVSSEEKEFVKSMIAVRQLSLSKGQTRISSSLPHELTLDLLLSCFRMKQTGELKQQVTMMMPVLYLLERLIE